MRLYFYELTAINHCDPDFGRKICYSGATYAPDTMEAIKSTIEFYGSTITIEEISVYAIPENETTVIERESFIADEENLR